MVHWAEQFESPWIKDPVLSGAKGLNASLEKMKTNVPAEKVNQAIGEFKVQFGRPMNASKDCTTSSRTIASQGVGSGGVSGATRFSCSE